MEKEKILKLSESVQYKPKEEPTKITLYADNKPYQVIDLKDVDDMSEEEYNDKLKDAWLKKTHYETAEMLTMAKYYNYDVEEQEEQEEEKSKEKTDLSDRSVFVFTGVFWGIIFGILIFALFKVF